MPVRVSLFLDYQNVYKCAREAFEQRNALSTRGQIHPYALGQLLVARELPPGNREARILQEVRVYMGRPSQRQDAKGYAASRAQAAVMERNGVTVITRSLRRTAAGLLEEKGIDVSLAIDFAAGAVDGNFDVGIIFSTDTDLLPALEFITNRPHLGVRAEVAAWTPHTNAALSVKGARVWCHRLTESDYRKVADPTVYVPSPKSAPRRRT